MRGKSLDPQAIHDVGARTYGCARQRRLAFNAAEESVAQIIEANSERYATPPSLRDVDAGVVKKLVGEARCRGYSVNMGYYLPGEGGLGLPIPRRGHYEVNVAVSFNAPLELMNDVWIEEIIENLRECLGAAILHL